MLKIQAYPSKIELVISRHFNFIFPPGLAYIANIIEVGDLFLQNHKNV